MEIMYTTSQVIEILNRAKWIIEETKKRRLKHAYESDVKQSLIMDKLEASGLDYAIMVIDEEIKDLKK